MDNVMEMFLELLSGGVLWPVLLIIGLALAAFGVSSKMSSAALHERLGRLREVALRVASLQGMSTDLALGVTSLDTGMRQRFETLEGNLNRLGSAIGEVRRETQFVEKQVGKLEAKADVASYKVDAVAQQVHAETIELKRIDERIGECVGKIRNYGQQIDGLEREVRSLEMKRVHYQLKNSIGLGNANARQISMIERNVQTLNGIENSNRNDLKRIDSEVKKSIAQVNHAALQITHLEKEVQVLESHEELKNGHGESKNGVFKTRVKAETELKSAYRKIEKLMDETISLEIGCQMVYSSERQSLIVAQENDEHYRKLIEMAEEVFDHVKKYFPSAIVQCMNLEGEQLEWCRAELFANASNPEAAKAYHQQVKMYLIKLKDSISKAINAIS